MERLTYEIIDGGIVVDKEEIKEFEIEDGITVYGGNAILRLAEYEYTDLTPGQIREIDKLYAEKCRELEELKKNHGLPCEVGDIVYLIDIDKYVTPEIIQYRIDNIVLCDNGEVLLKYDSYDGVICGLDNLINGTPYLDFYMIYSTREEAVAKLAEIKDGR